MTVRFAADENFNRHIIAGLQRRAEGIDIVRVQDVGLRTADDPTVLQWAADDGRVLLTHDAATMPEFAYARLAAQKAMPGVLVVRPTVPVSVAIEELALIHQASESADWNEKIFYLPLR